MKLYIWSWLDQDGKGQLTPFTNKTKAEAFRKVLEDGSPAHPAATLIDGMSEAEFPLNAEGVIRALSYGAEKVWK